MKSTAPILAQLVVLACTTGANAALGSAFTYQGRLDDGGQPANGSYDLQFTLFNTVDVMTPVPGTTAVMLEDVAVSDGLFTAPVDFGPDAFLGDERWLEIAVRPGAESGAFTTLSPRQELTAAPHAAYAGWAGGLMLPFAVEQDSADPLLNLKNSGNGLGGVIWAETTNGVAVAGVADGPGTGLFAASTQGHSAIFMGGNVGIGTETPAEKLSVRGMIYSIQGGVRFPDGTVQATAAVEPPPDAWQANSNGDVYYEPGFVGIGTDSPSATLELSTPVQITNAIQLSTQRFAQAANQITVEEMPSTAVGSGGGPSWVFPWNAYASDDARAGVNLVEASSDGYQQAPTAISQPLEITNFGFNLPAAAAISQIKVKVEGLFTESCGGLCADVDIRVHAQLLGGASTPIEGEFVGPAETTGTYFHGTWGDGWTGAQINASGFGVQLMLEIVPQYETYHPGNPPYVSPYYTYHDCPHCDASAWAFIDAVTVVVSYYDAQGAADAVDYAVGIPASSKALVIAPGSNPTDPVDNSEADGGIVIAPNGHVGIGMVPLTFGGWMLDVDGEIRCDGVSQASSRRYKRNVQPLGNALETVARLQGVTYDWDEAHGGRQDIGFIAEEVGAVVPQIVDFEPDGVNATGMRYDRINALSVEAIKELHALVREQKAEIAELRGQLEHLGGRKPTDRNGHP